MAKDQRGGDRHKPRTGDRHAGKSVAFRVTDESLHVEAMSAITAAKDGLGWTMARYLTECLKYVVGRRRSFPPRPAWAEERAAGLPPEEPPDPATEAPT